MTGLASHLSPEVAGHHQLILRAWRSTLGDKRVIYLSGPITTGLRRVSALEKGADEESLDKVLIENAKAMDEAARRLRHSNPADIIVEPASFRADGWSQDDYLLLWKALIEHHAGEVRFLSDWQYSIGCAKEFEHAVALGVPTSQLDGTPLSLNTGVELLHIALEDLAGRCQRTPGLAPLAQALAPVLERLTARS